MISAVLVVVLATICLNDAHETDWYLSSNGNDSSTCGDSASNACETLDWLLVRFHNTFDRVTKTLFLFTDTSLVINQELVEKHIWIRKLNVVISTTEKIENITTVFTGVSMFESDWIIHDINLMINQSNLDKMNFTLGDSHENDLNMKVWIYNSSFQHVYTANASECNISVIECFIDGNKRWKEPLLNVRNSEVHIMDSFLNNHNTRNGPAIIDAAESYVFIENTIFVHNIGKQGVIRVSDNSTLSLQTTVFFKNGQFFFAKSTVIAGRNSLVTVFQCNFSHNWASTGGCLYCNTNSYLIVHDSVMQWNVAQDGGVIYFQGEDNTTDEENEKLMKPLETILMATSVPDEAMIYRHFTPCFIQTSHFDKNFAFGYGGGALHVHKASVEIRNSSFSTNKALHVGGAIMAAQSNVNIMNTIFILANNALKEGGSIYATDHSFLNVSKCHVSGGVGIKDGIISIINNVILHIRNLTFDTKKYYFTDFAMHFSDHCTVIITHSNFITQYPSPGIFHVEDYSTLVVSETTFRNNGKPGSSVLSSHNNVKVKFTNCTFVKCAGLTVSGNTLLTIENCLITSSEYVLDQALILVSDGSSMVLHGTNISNNKPDVDVPFLQLEKSNATMSGCWYSGNAMSQHFTLTTDSFLSACDNYFYNNSFRFRIMYASIFYLKESKILIQDSTFKNNYCVPLKQLSDVVIFDAYSADIILDSCEIVHDMQSYPPDYTIHMRSPVFTLTPQNFLQINNCMCNSMSGSLRVEDVANVNIQSSFFRIHQRRGMLTKESGFQLQNVKNVRIAKSRFKSQSDLKTHINFRSGTYEFQLLTLNSSFTVGNHSLTSNGNNFFKEAKEFGIVELGYHVSGSQTETPYASVIPVTCNSTQNDCSCHYHQSTLSNIYNCSFTEMSALPSKVVNNTNWLLMEKTKVKNIEGSLNVINMIKFLDIHQSSVIHLSNAFLEELNSSKTIKWLDFRQNNLKTLPQAISQINNLDKVWLSDNPFYCDCSMIWMIEWLNNYTTPSGTHIIKDYQFVKCHSGMMKGLPIYVLNEVIMGCYPHKLTESQKIVIGIGTGVAGIIIAALVKIALKNSRDIQFFFFYYCVWCRSVGWTQHDKTERFDHMKYDAYLIYSNKDTRWVSKVFRRNKWKDGSKLFDLEKDHDFRLLVPQRDFEQGRGHQAQVVEGIQQSRKVIVIVSRNLLHSRTKMWNFRLIDTEALRRKNFILIVFKEKIKMNALPPELQTYYKLNLYVSPDENLDRMSAKIRFDLPRHPLTHLRPKDFKKIGDEEYGFDSAHESTDEDIPDSYCVEDAGGEALEPVDDQTSTVVDAGITSEDAITNGSNKSPDFGNDFAQEDTTLFTNRSTCIN